MSVDVKVVGYCPMGCGETLELDISHGDIWCRHYDEETDTSCPDPYAVTRLLMERETEHIVDVDSNTFNIQHPIRERLRGLLWTCELHTDLAELPPRHRPSPGRYRAVRATGGGWNLARLDGDPASPQEAVQQSLERKD